MSRLGNAFTYVDSIILDTVDEDTVFPAFGFSLLTNMYRCLRCRFFLVFVVDQNRPNLLDIYKSRETAILRHIYFVPNRERVLQDIAYIWDKIYMSKYWTRSNQSCKDSCCRLLPRSPFGRAMLFAV